MGGCLSCCSGGAKGAQQEEAGKGGGKQDDNFSHVQQHEASLGDGHVALLRDIRHFEATGQVPAGLSAYCQSNVPKTHAGWYGRLAAVLRSAQYPPQTPAEAAKFVTGALDRVRKANVAGLLQYYKLPLPKKFASDASASPASPPAVVAVFTANSYRPATVSPPPAFYSSSSSTNSPAHTLHHNYSNHNNKPNSNQHNNNLIKHAFQARTLPIDALSVSDGDTFTALVDVFKNLQESKVVSQQVLDAAKEWEGCYRERDHVGMARVGDYLLQNGNYRMVKRPTGGTTHNKAVLARKYRVRLRGIDCPESSMKHGPEATHALKDVLVNKSARLIVYETDQYGRAVCDVFVGNAFVQVGTTLSAT
eukprot:jgi/Chlat1/2710/Chrsp180S02877